jgi:hypothetical protein
MKLAWLTDIHLNFLELSQRQRFYQEIIKKQPEMCYRNSLRTIRTLT